MTENVKCSLSFLSVNKILFLSSKTVLKSTRHSSTSFCLRFHQNAEALGRTDFEGKSPADERIALRCKKGTTYIGIYLCRYILKRGYIFQKSELLRKMQKQRRPFGTSAFDYCFAKIRKPSGAQILRKNRRSRPEAVVTYCEWERTTILTKI